MGDALEEMKSGLSRMLSNDDIGLPVVRANNINDGVLDLNSEIKYWYKDDPQGANTFNYLVHQNDILVNFINSEAKMGTAALVKDEPVRPTIYTTNILKLRTQENYDSKFIFNLSFTKKYKDYVKSITKPAVNQASFTTVDFKRFSFLAPSYDEQIMIGEFFAQIDTNITLHQQKVDLLKKQKRFFLQHLFPKNGETVPKIRFSGFSDEWEQRKLGEESDVKDGTHDSPKYFDVGHPLVTSKNLKDFGLDLSDISFISDKDFKSINKRSKVDIGDILFGMIGTIGNPVQIDRNDFAIKNVALIKEKNKILNNFLLQVLKSPVFNRYIRNENAGGTQKFLSLSKIREFEFLCPNIEEQTKIGTFFKQLDNTITLHQSKLDNLKKLKQSLLQKMFI